MRRAWPTLVFAGCLSPTEVKVVLTSDACDAIAETEIFLGDSTTASATTNACGAQIGSIVMIPASARDATFKVRVAACDKAKMHCIKAARRVGFVPHTPLELPIALDRSCMDVACSPDQTCSKGGCVPDDVSMRCAGNVCEPPPPSDGGPPPTCAPPYVNPPAGGLSPFVWHFDALPVADDLKLCPSAPTIEIGPGMTCGSAAIEKAYDGGASLPQPLGCASNPSGTSSFHAAFWFRVPNARGAMLVQKRDPNSGVGWAFDMDVQGVLQFQAHDTMVPSVQFVLGPQLLPGTWHSVEVHVAGQAILAWLDKNPVLSASNGAVGATPNAGIVIGPLFGGAVDELWIYP